MAIDERLESQFRPEERSRGEALFAKDLVNVSSATDTSVRALVRATGGPRVTLEATDVADPTFEARCSCPTGAKGVLCKHVWASLLALDARDADFLGNKTGAEAIGRADPGAARRVEANARARERAKETRQRLKRDARPARPPPQAVHPEPVVEALAYFRGNGFDLAADLELARVEDAKRQLARVFHPDRGGTHDEAIGLNQNFEILRDYLEG